MKIKKVLALILSALFLTGCVVSVPESPIHIEPKQGYATISFAVSDEKLCEISLPDTTIFENGTYKKEYIQGDMTCGKFSAQKQFLDSGVFYNADLGGDMEIQIMEYSSDFYETVEKYLEYKRPDAEDTRKGEQNGVSWYAAEQSAIYYFMELDNEYLICIEMSGKDGSIISDLDSACSYFLDNIE